MLVCSISNEVAEDPVICKSSGLIYERRLLEKFIENHGKDPSTDVAASLDDIIDIKSKQVFIKPRAPVTSSLPSLIKMLQDEYDAAMLETFTLRKQLEITRQELSHSLYQHDAACRVIARLIKERDESRAALANMEVSYGSLDQEHQQLIRKQRQHEEAASAANSNALPEDVVAKITTMLEVLQNERKSKKKPQGLTTKERVAAFKESSGYHTLHASSSPGVLCLSVHSSEPNWILSGGVDKKAVLYDTSKDTIVASFKGHSKKVTSVCLHATQKLCITGSADTKVRLFDIDNSEEALHVFDKHTADITSISLHPTDEFFATSALDASWAFHDIPSRKTLFSIDDPDNSQITCAEIHPDGVLYGTGSSSKLIRMYDIRSGEEATSFAGHLDGAVQSISFSGNGYYIASTGHDNVVRLWDLRKLQNFKTIELDPAFNVSKVKFDSTGAYFAVSGVSDIKLYQAKPFNELATLQGHSKGITDLCWGPMAKFLVSSSRDRFIKVWSPNQ